jgi:hypothetical protein
LEDLTFVGSASRKGTFSRMGFHLEPCVYLRSYVVGYDSDHGYATLGDEFEEGEIFFILSLQRKTSCLTPFHSTTLGPQRSKSAWSGP